MVAYSFQQRFVEPILSGRKRQTIRALGKKRHASPGVPVQLYTAMRTKYCRLIGTAHCLKARPITIEFDARPQTIRLFDSDGGRTTIYGLDGFAQDDGFSDWDEMQAFWRETHGPLPLFDGIFIQWREFVGAP